MEQAIYRGLRKLGALKSRSRLLEDRGSALVEMAISFPILAMMLFAIIQFSIALYTYDFLSDAAREGARWAIVRGVNCTANTPGLDHCAASQQDVQNYVQGLGYPFASSTTVKLSYMTATTAMNASGNPATTWSTCTGDVATCGLPGNQVQVGVQCTYPLGIPFWSAAQLTMASTSSMVISQ
jgi:Flp pilus assembly protein TadG